MFFSVIVPVYNVEKYLHECVDSILGQNFKEFELILVDDGSTDSSPQICDDYALFDKRVKVIHKINGGLSEARNAGTDISSGQYIVYIDSDDYINDVQFLAKLYEKAEDKKADIICYKFKKYFADKKQFADCSFSCPDIERFTTLAERINYMVKCDAFYCSAWSKAFRADIIRENNIRFEKGLFGEDQEWYYHLLYHVSTITFIDEVFLVYRQRSNSITSSWKMKNLTDCVYVIEKWFHTISNSNLEEGYKLALLNSVAKLYCNLLIAYARFGDSKKKNQYGKIKNLAQLLNYHNNPRVNIFYKTYKIVSFDGLMIILNIVCKLR